eukprot:CAMPEP_0184969238 /NCGR_PEP_ID=MMETSP1098-20130426/2038_1 /TAXON_ID=89044 /ORGANISM="Spumella elongata, Strain CCAP 955/1" /LENGTH=96 /DNA_ID=CAMNT_0027490977 /DNA_START=161 /DNA_END=447 /DNA_ORIENTATION=+
MQRHNELSNSACKRDASPASWKKYAAFAKVELCSCSSRVVGPALRNGGVGFCRSHHIPRATSNDEASWYRPNDSRNVCATASAAWSLEMGINGSST